MQSIGKTTISWIWLGLLFLAAVSSGQDAVALFEKAPPEIDGALRARVTKFYQLHVEGKFRAADEFVAEDSKDAFFDADKPHCRAFDIMKISYAGDFSRATVVIACDTDFMMPMAGPIPVKMPVSSRWKTVDGEWMWYVEPVSKKGAPAPAGNSAPPAAAPLAFTPVDLATVSELVKTDRQQVNFDPAKAGAESVVVTNGLPGGVTLALQPTRLDGFELKLDRTSLEQGQSATLSILYKPSPDRKPSAAVVTLVVSPIMKEIPIQIRFVAPSLAPQLQ
jgi:hypothetical protein